MFSAGGEGGDYSKQARACFDPAGLAPVALGAKRFAFGRTEGLSPVLAFPK